jgi:large subunit ribosomal protein L4e
MARGHRIDQIAEVPLVVSDSVQDVSKTKDAVRIMKAIRAYADVEKSKDSRKIRAGKGKMRNRRYVQKKGPLIIYNEDHGLTRAFRNLPGVEMLHVDRLNLLQLAPGGHLGRFCIWTKSAFSKLDALYGTWRKKSTEKKNYNLPRPKMIQTDLSRLINSDEIQKVVRPVKPNAARRSQKKNPLKNLNVMLRLNPYMKTFRRHAILQAMRNTALKGKLKEAKQEKAATKKGTKK